MKKFLWILLFVAACNNSPQVYEVLADTTYKQRIPLPFGLGVVEPQINMRAMAMARAIEDISILKNGDTLVLTTVSKSVPYTTIVKTIRSFKGTPIPVPIPTGKYLSLPISGKIIAKSGQVIENLQFKNMADIAIRVDVSNVTIRNCFFNGTGAEAIELENANNVTVENNLFTRVTTCVYALSSSNIKVRNNQFVNVRMRIINGAEAGRGQFVQFNGVSGGEIVNNKGENFLGESNPEDLISLFNSSGTQASPILISGNMFRGGGPSSSGGGIMTGDNGGSWQIAENNTLLNPGQYGMAIAGGSNNIIRNNKIFAKQQPFTNNPLYMWAQAGTACSNNTVINNRATWTDKYGRINGGWDAGNCSNSNFQYPIAITESELGVLVHLIDMITPAELLIIRK